MIDRYIHVNERGVLQREKFYPIYAPVEAFLLNDQLPVVFIVPILCIRFNCDSAPIDDGIELVRLSDQMHLARCPDWRSSFGHDPRVETAATHALILTNWTIRNERQMAIWNVLGSADSYPLEQVDMFFAALRLTTSFPTGYAQLLTLPVGRGRSLQGKPAPAQKNCCQELSSLVQTNME